MQRYENGRSNLIQSLRFDDTKIIPQSFFTENGLFTINTSSDLKNQMYLQNENQSKNSVIFSSNYFKSIPSRLADTMPEIMADVSANGKRLVSLYSNELTVYEVESGENILNLKLTDNSDNLDDDELVRLAEKKQVVISPKGTFVAISHTGQIFEVNTGREVYNKGGVLSSICFSADEKILL
ncbi:MAG: hypothetical protein IPJ30_26520 [Acidobacteria bacterium]|nr:hypothetical protein [Acidobacteriota bacterium]